MSGMFPDNQVIEVFGEQVSWPGVGPDGKFTNGSFSDPLIKPSFIPAETLNLIIENLQNFIAASGRTPNNIESDQLVKAMHAVFQGGGFGDGLQELIERTIKELLESGVGNAPGGTPEGGNNTGYAPYLTASGKRKLSIKAGTHLSLDSGAGGLSVTSGVELDIASLLDSGSLSNGKDYYLFLVPGGDNVIIRASLNNTAPQGLTPAEVKLIGGFHTLCADAGSGMTYVEGGETKDHPLNGYVAGDILPQSVWCLNHRPHSEPEGMVYIPSLDFWCDIYLQSGSGKNTKSAYQGALTRSRQYFDHVEDMFCVKKTLLTTDEFSAAMLGSNELTVVVGASEAGATSGGAGGRKDTAGRRMISIYGIEEGCGSVDQLLRYFIGGGGSTWTTPSGSKGSLIGSAYAVVAGGCWIDSGRAGSRMRAFSVAEIITVTSSLYTGRGCSRPMRFAL